MSAANTSTMEVGKKLVALCQQGKAMEAVQTLFAKDVVSVEAASMPNMPAEMNGIDAVIGKNKWWTENHTIHHAEAIGPYPHGDRFAVIFKFEVTNKLNNQRNKMDEVALYTVKDGKVSREEFFYTAG